MVVIFYKYISHWCCSVAKLCPTRLDPKNCSTPGFPVLYHLLEFAQTHVHWVSDAIPPSQSLSPSSPPALSLVQHQSLFQWVSSSHQVGKVLQLRLQHQSCNEYSRLISFTSIAVWKMLSSSFKVLSAQSSLQSTSHIRTWLVEKIIVLAIWTFGSKVTSLLFNTRLVWS